MGLPAPARGGDRGLLLNDGPTLSVLATRQAECAVPDSVQTPQAPGSSGAVTPMHGRNELFRLTCVRKRLPEAEFWASLPSSSKGHLIVSALAAAAIFVYCIQQLVVEEEPIQIVLAELTAAIFFVWFAVEAVSQENAFELLAQGAVAACVAARIIYFMVTMQQTAAQTSVCGILIALLALELCMAAASYSQFGWRLYSKVACDLRAKDGKSKQKTYLLIHVFLSVMKLDTLLLLCLFLVGVTCALEPTGGGQHIPALLVVNPIGLVICSSWSAAVFFTVRNDWSRMEMPLLAALPVCCLMPAMDVVLAFTKLQPPASTAKTCLVLAAAIFLVLRSLVAVLMQVLVSRFRFLHLKRTLSDSIAGGPKTAKDVPAELVPLMKGAWIGKPQPNATRKRRFFQLSSDGSTLRWAWDKYILLYYVEAQHYNDENLEITLAMAMEPDLHLKFADPAQYCIWKRGLQSIIGLLEQPTDVLSDGPQLTGQLFAEAHGVPHGILRLLLLESRLPGAYTVKHMWKLALRRLGCSSVQRRSVQDPELKHFFAVKQRAQDLHALGVKPAAPHGHLPSASVAVQLPDSRHRRGNTIPSIQEIIDAIAQQESSPEKGQTGVQRQRSFGRRCRDLVIDCISPNTRQVRLSTRSFGSPPSSKNAAKVLFGSKGGSSTPDYRMEGYATRHPSSGSDDSRFQIGAVLRSCDAAQTAGGNKEVQMGATSDSGCSSIREPLTSRVDRIHPDQMPSEVIDSRESLDTVGPLPGESSRPSSAALLKSNISSPSKLFVPVGVEATPAAGQAVIETTAQKESSQVEVVIHEPAVFDLRWDPVRRSSGDVSSSALAVHPLIQRTRTTSSSGSFYGPSPIHSQGNSGNYASEVYSYTSAGSHSTISSSVSLYSNGPVKMSVPFIPIHDISVGRCLGEGSEGVVYAGSYLETPVAIKQLSHVQEMEMNLHIGSHDNVVALRGVSRREENLILVMEYCPKGTLHLMLHGTAQSEVDAFKLVSWVRAIARGMLHLHTRKPPILHRDLKPANIFVGHGFMMKIGDFGMSRHIALSKRLDGTTGLLRQLSSGVIGTASYAAPELLEGEAFAEGVSLTPAHVEAILKSDVYSFGVTLWEMMTRKRPFSDMMSYQIHHAWMEDPMEMQLPPVHISPDLTPPASTNLEELAALVRDCTQYNPQKRPSFYEICLRLKHLPPRSSSVLSSPVASEGHGFGKTPGAL